MTVDKSDIFAGVRAVWHRRKIAITATFTITIAVVSTLTVALPNIYRAEATLVVEDLGNEDRRQIEAVVQTLTNENLSHARLLGLIEELRLYPQRDKDSANSELVRRMRADISMSFKTVPQGWGPATIGIVIGYLATAPDAAVEVSDRLAQFYVERDAASRRQRADRTLAALHGRLKALEAQLAEEEAKVRAYKSQHRHELPEQVGVHLAALDRLTSQLQGNRDAQVDLLSRLDAISPPLSGVAGSGWRGSTEDERAALLRERARLSKSYTDEHPDVRAIDGQLRALSGPAEVGESRASRKRNLMSRPKSSTGSAIGDKINKLEREARKLSGAIAQHSQQVRDTPLREQELDSLLPGYQTTESRYRAALQSYGDAKLLLGGDSDATTSVFRIVDPATRSATQVAPQRLQLALFGLLFAAVLAIALAILIERADRSFHAADELRGFTRLPIVAILPKIVSPRERQRRHRIALIGGATAAVALTFLIMGVYILAQDNQSVVWLLAQHR